MKNQSNSGNALKCQSRAKPQRGTCRDLTVGVLASNVEDNEKVQTTNCKGSENCSGTVITGSVVRSHESEFFYASLAQW